MKQKEIDERTAAMRRLGYSEEDIRECLSLDRQFEDDCDKIAEQCEAEGYPSHGYNYELRVEQLEEFYRDKYNAIEMKYEKGEQETDE